MVDTVVPAAAAFRPKPSAVSPNRDGDRPDHSKRQPKPQIPDTLIVRISSFLAFFSASCFRVLSNSLPRPPVVDITRGVNVDFSTSRTRWRYDVFFSFSCSGKIEKFFVFFSKILKNTKLWFGLYAD